jgi:hypothetical protein
MRTIAASLLLFGAAAFAAAPETPFSTLSRLASYLSEGNAPGAISLFEPQMKGYGDLERNIEALASQTEVTCAIDVVSDEEAGGVHKLDLDWIVNLSSGERRRERVQVEMRQTGGKWKITSMSPLSILDAIHVI